MAEHKSYTVLSHVPTRNKACSGIVWRTDHSYLWIPENCVGSLTIAEYDCASGQWLHKHDLGTIHKFTKAAQQGTNHCDLCIMGIIGHSLHLAVFDHQFSLPLALVINMSTMSIASVIDINPSSKRQITRFEIGGAHYEIAEGTENDFQLSELNRSHPSRVLPLCEELAFSTVHAVNPVNKPPSLHFVANTVRIPGSDEYFVSRCMFVTSNLNGNCSISHISTTRSFEPSCVVFSGDGVNIILFGGHERLGKRFDRCKQMSNYSIRIFNIVSKKMVYSRMTCPRGSVEFALSDTPTQDWELLCGGFIRQCVLKGTDYHMPIHLQQMASKWLIIERLFLVIDRGGGNWEHKMINADVIFRQRAR